MSNILCVAERTVLRCMLEYGLKIRNFSSIFDNQLNSDVLALTNDYPFCGKTVLRELLKRRVKTIQRYRFRDSMHHVNDNTSHKFRDQSSSPHHHCCLQVTEPVSWHKLRRCYSANILQY